MDGVVIDALGVALGRNIECVCRSCVYTVCVVEVVLVRVFAVRLVAKGGWCWQRCFRYVDHPRGAVSRAARVSLAHRGGVQASPAIAQAYTHMKIVCVVLVVCVIS